MDDKNLLQEINVLLNMHQSFEIINLNSRNQHREELFSYIHYTYLM